MAGITGPGSSSPTPPLRPAESRQDEGQQGGQYLGGRRRGKRRDGDPASEEKREEKREEVREGKHEERPEPVDGPPGARPVYQPPQPRPLLEQEPNEASRAAILDAIADANLKLSELHRPRRVVLEDRETGGRVLLVREQGRIDVALFGDRDVFRLSPGAVAERLGALVERREGGMFNAEA